MEKDMTVGNPTKMILDHCREICRSKCTGSGRLYGNDHVFDHWISAGDDGWIYCAYGPEIWSR